MTREKFIQVLGKKGYSYEIEGEKIIITDKNGGSVDLSALTTLPAGVEFKNGGGVYLYYLTTLPAGVEFKNGGGVWLESLKTLPSGVEFKNGGYVRLNSLVGGKFSDWIGNIEGINSKRLLNVMISKGVFER